MSDILIKNMKMPDCCYGCPLVYDMGEGNYACPFFNGYAPIDGRRDDCPLVEVKPHGDLIARDALMDRHYNFKSSDGRIRTVVGLSDIENAPTVIESNKERSSG